MSFFREEIEGVELGVVGDRLGELRLGGWGGVMIGGSRSKRVIYGSSVWGELEGWGLREFDESGIGDEGNLSWLWDHFRRLGVLERYGEYVRMEGVYGYRQVMRGVSRVGSWYDKRLELLRRLKLMRLVLEHSKVFKRMESGYSRGELVEMRDRMCSWFLRCGWSRDYADNRRFQIMAFHSIRPALMKYFEDRGMVGKAVDVMESIMSDESDDVKVKALKFEVSKEVLKISGAYADKPSSVNTTVVSVIPDMMSKFVEGKKDLVLEMRKEQDGVETLRLNEGIKNE